MTWDIRGKTVLVTGATGGLGLEASLELAKRGERRARGARREATYIFPAIWEIDHIIGRGVRFDSAGVLREGGSDHFPVVATLRLATPPRSAK